MKAAKPKRVAKSPDSIARAMARRHVGGTPGGLFDDVLSADPIQWDRLLKAVEQEERQQNPMTARWLDASSSKAEARIVAALPDTFKQAASDMSDGHGAREDMHAYAGFLLGVALATEMLKGVAR